MDVRNFKSVAEAAAAVGCRPDAITASANPGGQYPSAACERNVRIVLPVAAGAGHRQRASKGLRRNALGRAI